MKKVCIAFSIIFGIFFAISLSLCLVAFLAHPVELGENILLAYEDMTGDLTHTVEGMWLKLSWISLWVSIGTFVVFALCLLGAILIKPERKREIKEPEPVEEPVRIEELVEKKEEVKTVKKERKHMKNPFKALFKRHKEEIKEEIEEQVEQQVETVVTEIKQVEKKQEDLVSDTLSRLKNRNRS